MGVDQEKRIIVFTYSKAEEVLSFEVRSVRPQCFITGFPSQTFFSICNKQHHFPTSRVQYHNPNRLCIRKVNLSDIELYLPAPQARSRIGPSNDSRTHPCERILESKNEENEAAGDGPLSISNPSQETQPPKDHHGSHRGPDADPSAAWEIEIKYPARKGLMLITLL